MNDIRLKLNEAGRGAFYLEENQEQLAEMEISVSKNILTVYHTEVAEKLKGQAWPEIFLRRWFHTQGKSTCR